MAQRLRGRVRRILLTMAILTTAAAAAVLGVTAHGVYFDRGHVPDIGPLVRFEFPTIGRVYDANDQMLIELAAQSRQITPYQDIPPVVRDAILAAEDKRFFSHNGVNYASLPRVITKLRVGHPATAGGQSMFAQGGSTITQQLVRGFFLQQQTSTETSGPLQSAGWLAQGLSSVFGPRNVNMLLRKVEEVRLSLWLEEQMRLRFGSKQRAKEEILARYASYVYLGHGQYGFAQAAEYYFGRRLATFTIADADKAAMLAAIMKSPRTYAPGAVDAAPVLHRRNQILALMADSRFLSDIQAADASARPLATTVPHPVQPFLSSAVVDHVLDEMARADRDLSVDDLLQGRIQVYSTVDFGIQRLASAALEHGLAAYEGRHSSARGIVQGSVIVLKNSDGRVLAETGGRQIYRGHAAAYSDYNRVRQARRQPGSAMKPIVYLAAFETGTYSLETIAPDEPIGIPNPTPATLKWIANYDGRFKGQIPLREALAESRNAVAIWLATQIGIEAVLHTARAVGVTSTLQPYPTTALGASEVSLMELATAYRTLASGIVAEPYVIRLILRDSGEVVASHAAGQPKTFDDPALVLIQEGLRGVVRIPTGTAHALDSASFPLAVMGKTGTTNDFRDALFVGSTYGPDGITVAVRIGFDDGRSLGSGETGAQVALPVFAELMIGVYRDKLAGPAPAFPPDMEARITRYLTAAVSVPAAPPAIVRWPLSRARD